MRFSDPELKNSPSDRPPDMASRAERGKKEAMTVCTTKAQRGCAATEIRNISRKDAKVKKSELSVLAPWREQYPNPRVFDSREICASRENFQL